MDDAAPKSPAPEKDALTKPQRAQPQPSAKASQKDSPKDSKAWVVIDAENMVVGRLASLIAARLRGKHAADYAPHRDCGDHVVVVNAGKIAFSGKKRQDKRYHRHTGYPGGIKTSSPEKILAGHDPGQVLRLAVKRMLPRGVLARRQLSHLRIYAESEHPHHAQEPQPLSWREQNRKNLHAAR